MTNLSTRAETAAPEDTRGLLEELRLAVRPWRNPDWRELSYLRLLNINAPEAHLAAVMMLVPEGWVSGCENWPSPTYPHARAWLKATSVSRIGKKEFWVHSMDDLHIECFAATPALALVAAIARATGEQS